MQGLVLKYTVCHRNDGSAVKRGEKKNFYTDEVAHSKRKAVYVLKEVLHQQVVPQACTTNFLKNGFTQSNNYKSGTVWINPAYILNLVLQVQ